MSKVLQKIVSPQQTIFYSIERTIKKYRQFAQRQIDRAGLDITIDQLLLMRALEDNEGITQTKLAHIIWKDYASVTRMIELLVKRGYLARRQHADDRRRKTITITKEGDRVLAALDATVADYRQQATIGIAPTDLQVVREVLDKIYHNCGVQKP